MRNSFTVTIITFFAVSFILWSLPHVTIAADDEDAISMHVLPEDVLYDIDNMKPGDWAPRTVTIENDGQRDFSYQVELDNNGPEKLFKELLLEVDASDENIYNGKIAHFTQLPLRDLKAGQIEELEFTIRFPEHLGNDYQGLDTSFSLSFTAVDEEDSAAIGSSDTLAIIDHDVALLDGTIGSSGDGAALPHTATNIYSILIIGAILATLGGLLVAYSRKRGKA